MSSSNVPSIASQALALRESSMDSFVPDGVDDETEYVDINDLDPHEADLIRQYVLDRISQQELVSDPIRPDEVITPHTFRPPPMHQPQEKRYGTRTERSDILINGYMQQFGIKALDVLQTLNLCFNRGETGYQKMLPLLQPMEDLFWLKGTLDELCLAFDSEHTTHYLAISEILEADVRRCMCFVRDGIPPTSAPEGLKSTQYEPDRGIAWNVFRMTTDVLKACVLSFLTIDMEHFDKKGPVDIEPPTAEQRQALFSRHTTNNDFVTYIQLYRGFYFHSQDIAERLKIELIEKRNKVWNKYETPDEERWKKYSHPALNFEYSFEVKPQQY